MPLYLLLLCLLAISRVASATPITYTLTGFGTGTLGSRTFTKATIRFTEKADTTDVVSFYDGFFYNNPGGQVRVNVSGFGTYLFPGGVTFLAEPNLPAEGFGSFGVVETSTSAFIGIYSSALDTYYLRTALPPSHGPTFPNQPSLSLPTLLGGDLSFTSFTHGIGSATTLTTPEPSAFTHDIDSATTSTTPEPSTFALLATGLLGITQVTRRKVQGSPARIARKVDAG